jgi:hypothetical protein
MSPIPHSVTPDFMLDVHVAMWCNWLVTGPASPLSKMISTGSSLFPTQALCKFFEVSGSVSKFLAWCYLITTEHLILCDKITAQKTVNFVYVLIQALRNGTKEGMLLSAIFVAKRLYLMLFSFGQTPCHMSSWWCANSDCIFQLVNACAKKKHLWHNVCFRF